MKTLIAACLLCLLACGPAVAETPQVSGYRTCLDCWIGDSGPPYHIAYIRCIRDRDLPYPPNADERIDAFLDELHRELHQRSGLDAERKLKANIELVRESASIWSIRINAYPYEWSWQEGLPAKLVHAAFCPSEVDCKIIVYPH